MGVAVRQFSDCVTTCACAPTAEAGITDLDFIGYQRNYAIEINSIRQLNSYAFRV